MDKTGKHLQIELLITIFLEEEQNYEESDLPEMFRKTGEMKSSSLKSCQSFSRLIHGRKLA